MVMVAVRVLKLQELSALASVLVVLEVVELSVEMWKWGKAAILLRQTSQPLEIILLVFRRPVLAEVVVQVVVHATAVLVVFPSLLVLAVQEVQGQMQEQQTSMLQARS